MSINKNTDLEFSLEKETEKGGIYTNFYTEDRGTTSIRIRLSSYGVYLDLIETGLKPVLFLFHEDGSVFEIRDFINVEPNKGLIQYNLSDNVISHAGQIKAKLFLRNTEQSVHVANFTFDIKDSEVEGAIAKEISVNLVDDTIKRIMNEQPEIYKGDKGDKGDVGPQGPQGDKGDTGEQGIQGIQGEKGENGTNGSNGADVSTHVTMTLLNGVLAYSDTRKPVYRVIDFGPSQIVSLGGMIKNIPVNTVTTIAVIPLRPYVDYFIPSNDSSVTVKVSTGGSVTVQTTTNWSTGRTLTFNGNMVI